MPLEIIDEVILTPEEIAEYARLNAMAKAQYEAEQIEEKRKKENIERLKLKINGTEDLVAIFKEAGVQAINHKKYIDDLINSENEAELDAILSYKASAKAKSDILLKEKKVFSILSKLRSIPKEKETNPIVVKYLTEQEVLLVELNNLLKD